MNNFSQCLLPMITVLPERSFGASFHSALLDSARQKGWNRVFYYEVHTHLQRCFQIHQEFPVESFTSTVQKAVTLGNITWTLFLCFKAWQAFFLGKAGGGGGMDTTNGTLLALQVLASWLFVSMQDNQNSTFKQFCVVIVVTLIDYQIVFICNYKALLLMN